MLIRTDGDAAHDGCREADDEPYSRRTCYCLEPSWLLLLCRNRRYAFFRQLWVQNGQLCRFGRRLPLNPVTHGWINTSRALLGL